MPARKRIAIVGAGHNALAAAFYLARAGRKPLVLERSSNNYLQMYRDRVQAVVMAYESGLVQPGEAGSATATV